MDDVQDDRTPPYLSWPGWCKAVSLFAASIAAWASVILPAMYFFD
jgi:hypothetical protein